MLKFQQKEEKMKKYSEILKKCPLFAGISEDDLSVMLNCLGARVDVFDKKYTVMSEGSNAKYLGIVLSGAVQIEQTDFYGNRSILSVVNEGEVFAEAFACSDTPVLPVSVIALKQSEIMFIESSRILHTCKNSCGFHNKLIYNLMKDIALKTVMFHNKIEIISKRSTREKLLSYLSMISKKEGSSAFYIPFDRQELADFLEVDRSGLSAEISKLKKEGILDCRKNYFELY